MLKINELFSGIGAFRKALINLGVEHEVVGIAEIDKYAIKSYEAMYGEVRNYGDISKSLKLEYADMWTYGFPCQDISVAGKQAGIERHTRSGLLYQVQRLLEVAYQYDELPKYLILENVKNLVGKKFRADFDEWLNYLNELGYNNYWKVLNAKNYGVPQNRERVFVVSIRKDIDTGYEFPMPFDNGIRLKDVLEDEVDEKFYISDYESVTIDNDHQISLRGGKWERQIESARRVYSEDYVSPTLPTCQGGNIERKVYTRGAANCNQATICLNPKGGRNGIDGLQPSLKDRIYDSEGVATAVTTSDFFMPSYTVGNPAVVPQDKPVLVGGIGEKNFGSQYRQGNRIYDCEAIAMCLHSQPVGNTGGNSYLYKTDYRIRKLTPKECWRLMGFSDDDFQKCVDAGISNSQLYKQAGNSIVVDVLFYMLKNLLGE